MENEQSMLFAWNGSRGLELSRCGEQLSRFLHQSDAEFINLFDIPVRAGVYVWEGTVEGHGQIYSDPPQDAEAWLEGEVRPATAADLRRFGLVFAEEAASVVCATCGGLQKWP